MLDLVAPWADKIMSAMLFVFAGALVPTLWRGRRGQDVPVVTSVLTASGEGIVGVALLSVDLVLSAAMCFVLLAEWGLIGVQSWRTNCRR